MEFVLSELCQQVMAARGSERPVYIKGGGTKRFYGEHLDPDPVPGTAILDMSGYVGIINYQPSELVMTVRAGTLLCDVEAALDEHNQMLAFEPPRFGPESTIGGCVASGLSGPRRMAAGSLRDFVLGAKLLDSSGTVLSFGGEVMKNVAGYDMSRLLAGSMGIFGALIEVSLKVVPKPFQEKTFRLALTESQALDSFNRWRGLPIPVSATAWMADQGADGALYVRVSGSEPAVKSAAQQIGGEALADTEASSFWNSLRDQTHAFFQQRPLWRLSVPPQTAALDLGPTLIEWNGGLRWVSNVESPAALRERIAKLGGHATLYRYEHKSDDVPVFHPLTPALKSLNRRLKQELDPAGIFNPKRLFPDF